MTGAAYTAIYEGYFNTDQPNGLFNQIGPDLYTNTGPSTKFQTYRNPPDDADPNSVWLFYRNAAGAGQDLRIGDNSNMKGKWAHFAWAVDAAGDTHFYVLLEGFNPASPSYLVTPALGLTQNGSDRASMWIQGTNNAGISQDIRQARLIICAAKLTEAQVLAQFAQRNPTAAVTAVSYTWLKCEDAATVEVDAGSTATNWTKTTTLTDEVNEPFEWIGTPADWQLQAEMPTRPKTLSAAVRSSMGAVSPVLPPSAPVAPTLSWAPVFPESAPRGARRPVATGLSVSNVLPIPAAAVPLLSWASTFPNAVPRARRPMLEGGGVLPVIPPPASVDWSEFLVTDESFDTEVVLQVWNTFPDRVDGPRRPLGQTGIVTQAPLPPGNVPLLSWSPRFPDVIRLPARPVVEGVSVSEPYLSALPVPLLSWAPAFPDVARGRARLVVEGLSVSEPGLSAFPVPPLSWAPAFPDIARGRQPLVAEGLSVINVLPLPPSIQLGWSNTFPDSTRGPRAAFPEGVSVSEPWISHFAVPGLGWTPTFPDRARGPRPLVPEGLAVINVLPIPTVTIPRGWAAVFPDVARGRTPLVPEGMTVSEPGLSAFPSPFVAAFQLALPDRVWGPRRPVAEGLSVSEPGLSALPVPALSWESRFPDSARGPRRAVNEGGVFATILPPAAAPSIAALSPTFPDRALGPRQLVAAGLSASVPYLTALPVPALSWAARFPDRVWGPARPIQEGAAVINVLPIPFVAIPFGWAAVFPDFAPGPLRQVAMAFAAIPVDFRPHPSPPGGAVALVSIHGYLTVGPTRMVVAGTAAAPSLVITAGLALERIVTKRTGDVVSVSGSLPLPFGGITAARFVYIRVLTGTLRMQLVSELGSMLVPLSGVWLWDNPMGPAITAITVLGTGDIEYQIAGT